MPFVYPNAPLAVLHDEILVEYSQFGLQDEETSESFASLEGAGEGVQVGYGCALFLSDRNDHYPAVRFESWSHEPPAPPAPWDVEEGMDDVIELPSGTVRLWELVGGPSSHAFPVGPAGRYRLRIHVRSYNKAVLDDQVEPDALFLHGIEQWLLRFWPTD